MHWSWERQSPWPEHALGHSAETRATDRTRVAIESVENIYRRKKEKEVKRKKKLVKKIGFGVGKI